MATQAEKDAMDAALAQLVKDEESGKVIPEYPELPPLPPIPETPEDVTAIFIPKKPAR